MDDISSVLGHDLFGAMQDTTITDDTMTVCGESGAHQAKAVSRKPSLKIRTSQNGPTSKTAPRTDSVDLPTDKDMQFGFENIVFEIDNRCDDQKVKEPVRYCSLAQFVEGNDIARKSFKVGFDGFQRRRQDNKVIFHYTVFTPPLQSFGLCSDLIEIKVPQQ